MIKDPFARTVIAGVPRAGKTTLAARDFPAARHTDDLIGRLDWSAASAEAATWFTAIGPWCVEGVAVPRAIRKWLAAYDGKPCDVVIWMPTPMVALSSGQLGMAKGCETVWREIRQALVARGVELVTWSWS